MEKLLSLHLYHSTASLLLITGPKALIVKLAQASHLHHYSLHYSLGALLTGWGLASEILLLAFLCHAPAVSTSSPWEMLDEVGSISTVMLLSNPPSSCC